MPRFRNKTNNEIVTAEQILIGQPVPIGVTINERDGCCYAATNRGLKLLENGDWVVKKPGTTGNSRYVYRPEYFRAIFEEIR